MVYQFVESRDRTHLSAFAQEDIRPGNLVRIESDGAYNATATDGVDGVALGLSTAAWVAEEMPGWRDNPTGDLLQNFVYTADDEFPMPYVDLAEDGQRLRLRLADDPGDGSPAPDVGARDVLGVIDTYPGRLVQEGYSADTTDDATANPVTYNRENGNFVPVGFARGTAPTVPVTAFHELVHLINEDY